MRIVVILLDFSFFTIYIILENNINKFLVLQYMNPSADDQNDELYKIFDKKLFEDGTIQDKLIKQAYNYYCKAMRYYRLNEIDGALINFLLALNNLYNLKKTFKQGTSTHLEQSVQEAAKVYRELNPNEACSPVAVIEDIDATIKKIIDYVVPLQAQLRKIKNDRGSNCDENKEDDNVECVDVKATLAEKKEDMLTFKNISGQETAKENIRNGILNPILYPRLFPNLSKGILFYGPPGTGKTLLAKAFVNELQIQALQSSIDIRLIFYAPKGSDLKGKYVGESEKKIRNWFKCAHTAANDCKTKLTEKNQQNENVSSSNVLSIIFIDEIEAIAGNRDDDPNGIMTTTVNALLQEMDGVDSYPNVIVMAATNYPWKLDGAILRRFDTKIYVSLPTEDDIASLIKSQIYFDFIKPALKKPKDLNKKEEVKKSIFKGDLKCGDRDSISLIKYERNDDPKPEQFFDYFRTEFFPQLTDRFIQNFSKGLAQHNYSGGDVKNVLRHVFKTMGKRAIDQNVFTDRMMVNPETLRFEPIDKSFHKNACDDRDFTFKLFSTKGDSDSLDPTNYKKAIFLCDSSQTKYENKSRFNIFTRRTVSQELLDQINYITTEDLFLGNIELFRNSAYAMIQLGDLYVHIDYIPRLFEKMADFFITYYLEYLTERFRELHPNITVNQQFAKERFVEMYDIIYHICELSHDESHKNKYLNIFNLVHTLRQIINYDENIIAIDLLIEVEINGYPENFKNLSNKIWVSTKIAGDQLTKIIHGNSFMDDVHEVIDVLWSFLPEVLTKTEPTKIEIPLKLEDKHFRLKFDEFTKYETESNSIRNKIFKSTKNIYCIEQNRHVINEPIISKSMKKDEIVYILDLKAKDELKFNGKFGQLVQFYEEGEKIGNWNVRFQDDSNHDFKPQNIRRTVQYNRISNMIIRKDDPDDNLMNKFLESLSTGTINVKIQPFGNIFKKFILNANVNKPNSTKFFSKYFTLNSLYSLSGTIEDEPNIVKTQYTNLDINPIIIYSPHSGGISLELESFDFVSNLSPDDNIFNIMYDIQDEPLETKKKGVRKIIGEILRKQPDANKNYQPIIGDITNDILYHSSGYYVKVGNTLYALYTVPYSPMMKAIPDQLLHGGNGVKNRKKKAVSPVAARAATRAATRAAARASPVASPRAASPVRAPSPRAAASPSSTAAPVRAPSPRAASVASSASKKRTLSKRIIERSRKLREARLAASEASPRASPTAATSSSSASLNEIKIPRGIRAAAATLASVAEAASVASVAAPTILINPVRVISKIDGNSLFIIYSEDTKEWKIDSTMFFYDEKDKKDIIQSNPQVNPCIEEIENFRKITLSFVPYDFKASIDPRRKDSVRAAASKDIIDDLNNYVIRPQLREDKAKEREKKAREERQKKEQQE